MLIRKLNEIENTIDYSTNENVEKNVEEFIYFSEKNAINRGYFLNITNKTKIEKPETKFSIYLQSEKMNITKSFSIS